MRVRISGWIVAGVAGALLLAEGVCRWGMGLGEPQLSVADAELDYRFVPGQSGVYRGCRYAYNQASMRSDREIMEVPLLPGRRRVIVAGDSIVNGEARTDQDDLATSLLDGVDGMEVYNLSACSWGPLNVLAYFRRYGTLGATDVVFVFSDHDLWDDDPALAAGEKVGLSADFQARKPFCALWEWGRFYLYPQVRCALGRPLSPPPLKPQGNIEVRNLEACAALFRLPIVRKAVVFHRTQREWAQGKTTYGEQQLRRCAMQAGVPFALLEAVPEADYRDNIHLNVRGQRKLAALIGQMLSVRDVK